MTLSKTLRVLLIFETIEDLPIYIENLMGSKNQIIKIYRLFTYEQFSYQFDYQDLSSKYEFFHEQ